MPVGNGRNDYVSPLLTNVAVDYAANAAQRTVAEKILPTVLVEKPDSEYIEFSKNNLVVPENVRLADNGGIPKSVDFNQNRKPINCEDVGLRLNIDLAKMGEQNDPMRYRQRRLESLVNRLTLRRELDTLAFLRSLPKKTELAGDGTGAENRWSGAGGDPIELMDSIREAMLAEPNTMVLGRNVYYALRKNPVVLDRLKQNYSTGSGAVRVTTDWLASLFEIPSVTIATPWTVGSREELGKADPDIQRIWDNVVWVGYVEPNPTPESLTFGAHFGVRWPEADELGWLVSHYEDKAVGVRGGEVLKITGQYKDVAMCQDCGHLITNILG